jgi:hypothetical protein
MRLSMRIRDEFLNWKFRFATRSLNFGVRTDWWMIPMSTFLQRCADVFFFVSPSGKGLFAVWCEFFGVCFTPKGPRRVVWYVVDVDVCAYHCVTSPAGFIRTTPILVPARSSCRMRIARYFYCDVHIGYIIPCIHTTATNTANFLRLSKRNSHKKQSVSPKDFEGKDQAIVLFLSARYITHRCHCDFCL